jgi:hypothetical protein
MLVSGLTGMPTPNMTATDRQQFETGKAAGALSVPAVAGAVVAPEAIQPVEDALAGFAKSYPTLAKLASRVGGLGTLYEIVREASGSKK